MDHVLIIIAGMPAAGKTTFAKYLSEELRIPLVCKDRVKEILFDELHYDAKTKPRSLVRWHIPYLGTFVRK